VPGSSKDIGRSANLMKIYISAPMAGLDHANKVAVQDAVGLASRRLRAAGFTVLSLTECVTGSPPIDLEWRHWLRAGIGMVLEADGVVRIPGEGRAPVIECRLAHELGLPIKTVPGWLTYAAQTGYMERLREDPT
jgi:hypothetical protein